MTPVLKDSTLVMIEDLRDSLARELALPFDAPAYAWPQADEPFYPVLPAERLEAIIDGSARHDIARVIDHTILKPDARPAQIDALCTSAIEHRFYSVCVNGGYVAQAARRLEGTGVALAAVIGFPLGQMSSAAKAHETHLVVEEGASEIDMVQNVGWLKAGLYHEVLNDMREVVYAAGAGVPVKVIIETCLLDEREKIVSCLLALWAGAAFVKTSTGFSTGGATIEDIALMRAVVGRKAGVKASGGVRSYAEAIAMLRAGASRIGTSSGAAIIQGK